MPSLNSVIVRFGASAIGFLVAYGLGWLSFLSFFLTAQTKGRDADVRLFTGFFLVLGFLAFVVSFLTVGLRLNWRLALGLMLGGVTIICYGLRSYIPPDESWRVVRFCHFFVHFGLTVVTATVFAGMSHRRLKEALDG